MVATCGLFAKICASVILVHARDFCTPEGMEAGRRVLEAFVTGVASSVKQHPLKESIGKSQFLARQERTLSAQKGARNGNGWH